MKVANFRKSLSRGFVLSMGLLSLHSLGNPLRSTCNKSMRPVVFQESELCFMEQRGVWDRLKEIPLQNVKKHV